MIGLLGVKPPISGFPFLRNGKEQKSVRADDSSEFIEHPGWLQHVFEGVMAEDAVTTGVGQKLRALNKFDSQKRQRRGNHRRQVVSDPASAPERAEIPSPAAAKFKNHAVWFDQGLE
jgi:hypothetical protein